MIILGGCAGSSFTNSSTDEPAIRVENDVFDVTVDECIDILNQEFERENLAPIPKEYEVIDYDGWTVYKAMLGNNIMFRLVTYDAQGDGIVRIGLSVLDSFEYYKDEKTATITISKAEKKASKKYFEIICRVVRPNFNPKPFMQAALSSTFDYELDGMVFFANNPSLARMNENDESCNDEYLTVYEVISSKALYEEYQEDSIRGDYDIFFNYAQGLTKAELNEMLQSSMDDEKELINNKAPILIALMVLWLISLISALYRVARERKEKRKLAMAWKVVLIVQTVLIAMSLVQTLIFFDFLSSGLIITWLSSGLFSSSALAGIAGNAALIYSLKNKKE